MKKDKAKELHSKTDPELQKQLTDIVSDLQKIQLDSNMGKIKNTNLYHEKLKSIARIKTVLRSRHTTIQHSAEQKKELQT